MAATIAQNRLSEAGLPLGRHGAANVQLAASLADIGHTATATYWPASEAVWLGAADPVERRQVIPFDRESTPLPSVLFDLAFLGLGGALLISTIDIRSGLVSLAIGVLAAVAGSVMGKAPRFGRSRNGDQQVMPSRLLTAAA